ncbi:MAG: response regulator [Lachnospiraceae bacterium]
MKILLADDSEIVREGIACKIKKVIPDAEIDDFPDGKYAWEAAQKKTYDLVLTDIRMRIMHGPELAERIHTYAPGIPILFMTGESPLRIQEMGIQEERCILKPVTAEKIKAKLDELDTLPPFVISPPIKTEQEKPEIGDSTDEGILETFTGFFEKRWKKIKKGISEAR